MFSRVSPDHLGTCGVTVCVPLVGVQVRGVCVSSGSTRLPLAWLWGSTSQLQGLRICLSLGDTKPMLLFKLLSQSEGRALGNEALPLVPCAQAVGPPDGPQHPRWPEVAGLAHVLFGPWRPELCEGCYSTLRGPCWLGRGVCDSSLSSELAWHLLRLKPRPCLMTQPSSLNRVSAR